MGNVRVAVVEGTREERSRPTWGAGGEALALVRGIR